MKTRGAKATRPEDALTSTEVQRLGRLSFRQLDYYVRAGWVRPLGDPNPGSGNPRRFDPRQALKAGILAKASAAGVEPGRLIDSDRSVASILAEIIVELKALHEAAKANHL